MPIAVQTEHLRREYPKLTAVADLDLSIEAGECFALVGPNGAGKTTTLEMLATLLEPTDGRIYIAGLDAEQQTRAVRRRIGFMPDEFGLYTELLVWEYLDYFATAYGVPRAERARRVSDVMDLVDLESKKESFVRELSRGMKQRLFLAKTLVHNPDVLLLDEPAANLDPRARIEFRELMKELVKLGKTIVVSSHILTELSDFCTSVGIIEKGKLVVAGKIDDILQRLQGATRIEIRVLDGLARLDDLLARHPLVVSHDIYDHTVQVEFSGKPNDIADLHRDIVTAGVRVRSFHEQRENLEDIFMKIGAYEVS